MVTINLAAKADEDAKVANGQRCILDTELNFLMLGTVASNSRPYVYFYHSYHNAYLINQICKMKAREFTNGHSLWR